MTSTTSLGATERLHTVVIGGGQSGLSVGYHLARRDVPFVILEGHERVGDTWRNRWDSLRLFTPRRYDGLDGMPFPTGADRFPTKGEMADYLEAYARRFALPVRTGVRVGRLWKEGNRFVLSTGQSLIEAEHVVVAMSGYQQPKTPAFASTLAPDIVQLHSRDYRNPGQLRDGAVLVVGAGNSGAEIALELARAGHETWLSGEATGEIPFHIEGNAARFVFAPLMFRVAFHRVLTVDTPIGRRARVKMLTRAAPLIRTRARTLDAAGVRRVPRTTGTRDGAPQLADGRVLDVANVVWCTGYHPDFRSWIDLPVLDDNGYPVHDRGRTVAEPGLWFAGLHFLYAMSSAMVHGVGRDAERIAAAIAGSPAQSGPASAPPRRALAGVLPDARA